LAHPLHYWEPQEITNLLYCCVILHNMTLEERQATYSVQAFVANAPVAAAAAAPANNNQQQAAPGHSIGLNLTVAARVAQMIESTEDVNNHEMMRADLVEHVWTMRNQG
jgi:hypothetical protein